MSASVQNLSTSNAITDFSQYYDPSSYWQNTALYGQSAPQTWAAYDSTISDYTAYYQQQAAAVQQNDSSQSSQDLALVGKQNVF